MQKPKYFVVLLGTFIVPYVFAGTFVPENCFLILNNNLILNRSRIREDNLAKTPEVAAPVENKKQVKRFSLGNIFKHEGGIGRGATRIKQLPRSLSPERREVLENTIHLQEQIISLEDTYFNFVLNGNEVLSAAQDRALKHWVDLRFERVLRDLTRESKNMDDFLEKKTRLSTLFEDMNHLQDTKDKNRESYADLISRYAEETNDYSIVGDGIAKKIADKVNNPAPFPSPVTLPDDYQVGDLIISDSVFDNARARMGSALPNDGNDL